jgi:hypothetical protein
MHHIDAEAGDSPFRKKMKRFLCQLSVFWDASISSETKYNVFVNSYHNRKQYYVLTPVALSIPGALYPSPTNLPSMLYTVTLCNIVSPVLSPFTLAVKIQTY